MARGPYRGSSMRRRFLVTGGAGYVGSHVVAALVERGDDVVVIDNLSQGHRAAMPDGVRLVVADLADAAAVDACSATALGTRCCISPRCPWSARACASRSAICSRTRATASH